jgi:hypothetical protein
MSRSTAAAAAFLLGLSLAACGGGGDDGPDAGLFGHKEDLDRTSCASGALAGMQLDGVWHGDVHIDGIPPFPLPFAIADAAGTLTISTGTQPVTVVEHTDDDLFLRFEYTTTDGQHRVRAYDLCVRESDKVLSGPISYCWDEECYPGTIELVRVERIEGEPEAGGLALVSEWNGGDVPWTDISVNVRVKDSRAYVAGYRGGLHIVDIATPATPHDLGHLPTAVANEIFNDVKLVEDGASGKLYALMASNRRGVIVVDVSDPTTPVQVTSFPVVPEGARNNVHTLFTETIDGQTIAYLANVTKLGLDVYDVTNPAQPVFLGDYVHPDVATDPDAYVHDLQVEGKQVYLCYWSQGLVVVDASDTENIHMTGQWKTYERRTSHSVWVTTTTGGRKIAVHGDEDFTSHIRIVDLETMEQIGELSLRPEVSAHNIMAVGDRAFVAYYQDGLRVLDLSDPTQPTVEAYHNTWEGGPGLSFYEGAIGVDVNVETGAIYVADTQRGLMIFRETTE